MKHYEAPELEIIMLDDIETIIDSGNVGKANPFADIGEYDF